MKKFPEVPDSDQGLDQERQETGTEKPEEESKPKEISEEQPVESLEKKPEHIPTLEEVSSVFRELIGNFEDEQGIYLYEVKIPGDLPGEEIGYEYMRKGRYGEGSSLSTEIHIVYYENGNAVGGTSAARYVDGKWIIL
jgi:hypothetical protein